VVDDPKANADEKDIGDIIRPFGHGR
jgi:hypothetical protein